MSISKKKYITIHPRFIKDSKGKVLQVLLTMEEYNSILKTSKSFDILKESLKKKNKKD